MSAYGTFAFYYDSLTRNVGYRTRADYFLKIMENLGHEPGLTLDLACGTGNMTILLKERGIDIYGIDGSMEMLSVARQKASERGLDILLLCQQMQRIDLYGTVDTVLCTLDSINHLITEKDVADAFSRISLFLNPGGYFLFDMNTLYKHKEILGNHTFVYDMDEVYCVWQNSFDPKTYKVAVNLDFFQRDGKIYHRSGERFCERAYSLETIQSLLQKAGLELVTCFGDLTFDPPKDDCERIVIAAKKPQE